MEGDRPLALQEPEQAAGPAASPHAPLLVGAAFAGGVAALPLLAAPLIPTVLPVLPATGLAGALLLAAAGFAGA
ncbi:MAG: hypothetical protein J0I21_12505, partial [Alphaproteobacteria bacterium]|nr:hypothetical protein [Alphaproteobacteria bacterium]